ncbi:MAG: hypothetical protein H7Z76_10485 [Methylotenera sp.]|nr:hypothetical protein [Flavobacterium sp.]
MKTTAAFWNYFTTNQKRIANLRNELPKTQKQIDFWLDRNIKNYCHHLDYLLVFGKSPRHKSEIIITANGNPLYFNYVTNLVKAAPNIKGWKISAFIPPKHNIEEMEAGLDTPYVFCDLVIKTSDLKFTPLNPDSPKSKLDIIIHLKDFSIYFENKILLDAVFIVVQDLLGEKSLYENLNLIHLGKISDQTSRLFPLYELQNFINQRQK